MRARACLYNPLEAQSQDCILRTQYVSPMHWSIINSVYGPTSLTNVRATHVSLTCVPIEVLVIFFLEDTMRCH